MKRCPICGAVLTPEEMLTPYCGTICKACDAIPETHLNARYPVWYEALPSLGQCFVACSRTSRTRLGTQLGTVQHEDGARWIIDENNGMLYLVDHHEHQTHRLSHEPKQAAVMAWMQLQRTHGLEHCWCCHEWRPGCVEVMDCDKDTGMRACPTCHDRKLKTGHW